MTKKLLPIILAALSLTACSKQKKADTQSADQTDKKTLVLYYSQTGATKTVAEELQRQLNADIEQIDVDEPYEGDFAQTIERCQKEKAAGEMPNINPLQANITDYDTIFIGYPVWFGTYATPIAALVKKYKFEGKKIVPFCTFGSGGLQTSTRDLAQALPQAEVLQGYGVRTARISAAPSELTRFLIEHGYIEGEVEALPDYLEQQPCTPEEVEIFNQACSDYQYPLGTPVTVGARTTPTSTDYLYTAVTTDADGNEQTTQIYVTVSNKQGSKPEFTQVVR